MTTEIRNATPHRDVQKSLAQLIAKSWVDPQFSQRLKESPETVLAENGIDPASLPEDWAAWIPEIPEELTPLTDGDLPDVAMKCCSSSIFCCR